MLIASIVVYGLATIAFGLSRSFWLTFACLAVTGAADTVSTVFRNLIRQLETPDGLRGRMVGVNMVFFIGGPQLGELEAGLLAQWARTDRVGRQRRDRLSGRDRVDRQRARRALRCVPRARRSSRSRARCEDDRREAQTRSA